MTTADCPSEDDGRRWTEDDKNRYKNRTLISLVYSNTNGPNHLWNGDGSATLCGVTRFYPYYGPPRRLCPKCRRVIMNKSAYPAASPADLAKAEEAALAGLADMQEARKRIAEAFTPILRQSTYLDGWLDVLHRNGYTLAEIGAMLGYTRERVRQRINAGKATANQEVVQ